MQSTQPAAPTPTRQRRHNTKPTETMDWYIVSDTGFLLLWKVDPQEGGVWVDEQGEEVPDAQRVRLVQGMSKEVLKQKLGLYNTLPEQDYFDRVHAALLGMMAEDFVDQGGKPYMPVEAYTMGHNGDIFLVPEEEAVEFLREGGQDPNQDPIVVEYQDPTPPPVPVQQAQPTPAPKLTPPAPPKPALVEPEITEGEAEEEPDLRLYQEGMKRPQMIQLLSKGGYVAADLVRYFSADQARQALQALDAGDQEAFERMVVVVKEAQAKKEEASSQPTLPLASLPATAPLVTPTPPAPAREKPSSNGAPAPTTTFVSGPARVGKAVFSLSKLVKAAKGKEWTWRVSQEEAVQIAGAGEANLLAALYGTETEEEIRSALSSLYTPEVLQKVMSGVEVGSTFYPGVVDVLVELGLIEKTG